MLKKTQRKKIKITGQSQKRFKQNVKGDNWRQFFVFFFFFFFQGKYMVDLKQQSNVEDSLLQWISLFQKRK